MFMSLSQFAIILGHHSTKGIVILKCYEMLVFFIEFVIFFKIKLVQKMSILENGMITMTKTALK
jgi:hypothetical protein